MSLSGSVVRLSALSHANLPSSGDGEPTSDCEVYESCKSNLTFVNVAFQSAAMEYNWICGKSAYLKSLFSQIQFAGVLCGTFSFGAVSDLVGRKPVAVFALSLGILMNFVTGKN